MSPEWLAKNPVGKVPVLEDDDIVMFESGAMVEYILDRYGEGRLAPQPGSPDYLLRHALYLQWSWFGEATFSRPLGEIVNHRRNFDPPIPEVVQEMKGRVLLCVAAINDAVKDKTYLLGEFSAADIMVGYCLALCERLIGPHEYESANGYWQTLSERPAAKIAFGDLKNGPLGR